MDSPPETWRNGAVALACLAPSYGCVVIAAMAGLLGDPGDHLFHGALCAGTVGVLGAPVAVAFALAATVSARGSPWYRWVCLWLLVSGGVAIEVGAIWFMWVLMHYSR